MKGVAERGALVASFFSRERADIPEYIAELVANNNGLPISCEGDFRRLLRQLTTCGSHHGISGQEYASAPFVHKFQTVRDTPHLESLVVAGCCDMHAFPVNSDAPDRTRFLELIEDIVVCELSARM